MREKFQDFALGSTLAAMTIEYVGDAAIHAVMCFFMGLLIALTSHYIERKFINKDK